MSKNKLLTHKERDAAIEKVVSTVRKRAQAFEKFLTRNWPADVPADCELLEGDFDCISFNRAKMCRSCTTYISLSRKFDEGRKI